MSNLVKRDFPNLPAIPDMLTTMMPPSVPILEYKTGVVSIFTNLIHNIKEAQIEESMQHHAGMMEAAVRTVKAQKQILMEMMLMGEEMQAAFQSVRNKADLEALLVDKQRIANQIDLMEFNRLKAEYDRMMEDFNNGANQR
jgi:hypothetical protein